MKRILTILLLICLCFSMTACGGFGYGVDTVQTLVEQDYSLAFRNNDPVYYYVTAAISVLAAQGRVEELSLRWLGDANALRFAKQADVLDDLIAPGKRVFTVGMDINAFPMSYISNGEFWGLDAELARAVADLLGWELHFQAIEKENVYVELSSGNIDCAWGGIALDKKEVEKGLFTSYGPYIKNDIVIATRNGSSVWNKLRLGGRRMTMPSTPEALAALNTDERLVKRLGQVTRLAGGTVECFEQLYAGKCDVVLTDSTAVMYFNCH